MAANMGVREVTNTINRSVLQDFIRKNKVHYVKKIDTGRRYNLKRVVDDVRAKHAKKLAIGDIVLRELVTGDRVLLNRQPSLTRYSIMGFIVRVDKPGTNTLSLRFNQSACHPFNADFDGDEVRMFCSVRSPPN